MTTAPNVPQTKGSSGFSLVEVMAAMVITAIFLAAITPILTLAANTLMTSRRRSIATTLIQRDMENLRAEAINCNLSNLDPAVTPGDDRYLLTRVDPAPVNPSDPTSPDAPVLEFAYSVGYVSTQDATPIMIVEDWGSLVWCDRP
jgi:prepilin-type N-terminal cleavage/methylation domain-containing protein